MADNDAPRAGPVWTLGSRLAGFKKRIPIHCYTQNMKALGLVVSEKKICFYVFPMTHRGGARMDPRGTVGRIYKDDHYTLLHAKYKSSWSCGFGEDFFLCFYHDASTPYRPQGHGWQDLLRGPLHIATYKI